MKICTIVGARPQFIKAAAVSAAIAKANDIEEVIIHTGQHYDTNMSDIFFNELGIPKEKYNLQIGSGLHGIQTGKMLAQIEEVLIKEKPDWVLIYGDTNSTVAGALASSKLHIPVAHVEAGMRSFNRKMPEEINRVVSDHISVLNLCSTDDAIKNLETEGRGDTAKLVGDVMYDCVLNFTQIAEKQYDPLTKFGLTPKNYILMTCHRAENTDDPKRLGSIVNAVNKIAETDTVILPLHPRTKQYLANYNFEFSDKVLLTEPISYLEILILEKNAKIVLTDSGGIQKEAFFFSVPCITMRDETEWVETVNLGCNVLTGADQNHIIQEHQNFCKNTPTFPEQSPYGDGKASEKILDTLRNYKH